MAAGKDNSLSLWCGHRYAWACARAHAHSREYTGNTKWTQWVFIKKEDMTLGEDLVCSGRQRCEAA